MIAARCIRDITTGVTMYVTRRAATVGRRTSCAVAEARRVPGLVALCEAAPEAQEFRRVERFMEAPP